MLFTGLPSDPVVDGKRLAIRNPRGSESRIHVAKMDASVDSHRDLQTWAVCGNGCSEFEDDGVFYVSLDEVGGELMRDGESVGEFCRNCASAVGV